MSAIGGYFELELDFKGEYHQNAIRLNTGRNSLEYILLANQYAKVYLPYYTCSVLLEPFEKTGTLFERYEIDHNFEPVFDFSRIGNNEAFLYTNYFGLKDQYIQSLLDKCKEIIIDNAQSFFSKPLKSTHTFYSPRKFFGISDGAYLFTAKKLSVEFKKDYSYQRFEHLLTRIDVNAETGYNKFSAVEESLNNQPILAMSELTQRILAAIDYNAIASKRRDNFNYLSKNLKDLNPIKIDLSNDQVPMVYPFFSEQLNLRTKLIENQIYTSQYWIEVLPTVDQNSIEFQYATKLIHLPVDQRYSFGDLDTIINIIKNEHQG
jgi:hypothetical protein